MAKYDNPIDKAKGFLDKYIPLLKKTGGNDAYWQEVISMAEFFKDDPWAYSACVEFLENVYKGGIENNGAKA